LICFNNIERTGVHVVVSKTGVRLKSTYPVTSN